MPKKTIMKKALNYIILMGLFATVLSSCHKLNVPITSELTPNVFPQDSAQFIQAEGPVYVALRGSYGVEYFFMQTLSTDEEILPARGGNWFNSGENQQLHYHNWNAGNAYMESMWSWTSTIIGLATQEMNLLNEDEPAATTGKATALAEIRAARAYGYFMMMDLFGSVPIDTTAGSFVSQPQSPRATVAAFIESELKAAIPNLSTTVNATTYGRMTKYAAYALLAKLYLNDEYYTGTNRYNDCIAACDTIINSGAFSLQSMSTYFSQFAYNNGPGESEFIFAIPENPTFADGPWGFRGTNLHMRYDPPRSEKAKFSLSFVPSAPESTIPSYYAYFYDPGDIRNKQWLTGLQYMNDGVTPVTVTTTNLGYNQFYTGSDPGASYTYQVNLTPDILLRQDVASFDCGNDEIAWNMGYRCIKFYPDSTSPSTAMNNDIPVFRYSDILLEKAEAILRGGTATLSQTPLSLANQLRAQRTTATAWINVTLDSIYNERCREFTQESWHRNDMIRFGYFENAWGFKTDADQNHRIYPIPVAAIALNTKLVQNPGY
jgi:starch-binding outer membrane protein, SusD/RagB family